MPSELHTKLQNKFLIWLANKATPSGIRASRELCLADGYVADCVAVVKFEYGTIRRACSLWGFERKQDAIGSFIRESTEPDYERLGGNYFSIVAEVKVSRSDFLSTFSSANGKHANRHSPIADLHVVVTPKGLVKQNEVPTFWGLLEQSGGGLRVSKWPTLTRTTNSERNSLAANILWHSAAEHAAWNKTLDLQRAEDEIYRKLGEWPK